MLIDSHCHLVDPRYNQTPEEIAEECEKLGISKLINIGTSTKDPLVTIKNVFNSVGVYPHEDKDFSLEEIQKKLQKSIDAGLNVVAVGECGIDITNHFPGRDIAAQKELFELQIKLALKNKLPIIVHNRNGDSEILEVLKKYQGKGLRGVNHCFDSNWEYAQKILDLGLYISFSGLITYPGKDDLLEVVEKIPMSKFLVETDAPYLPPQRHRGQVNYPKYVRIIAEKVASVKNIPFEEIARQSYQNTCSLFNI